MTNKKEIPLTELMNNMDLVPARKKAIKKVEMKKRKSNGNSADDVLINDSERMLKYIPEKYKKINSMKDARKAVRKIGFANDDMEILKDNLIPETTKHAKEVAARNYYRAAKKQKDVVDTYFWGKNRYAKLIKFNHYITGKPIEYWRGYNLTKGSQTRIPDRVKSMLKNMVK